MTAIKYRRDIDGLRAVAILSVVGYHVGIPGFGGGFVGVDVFFVISGFLITGLLVNELREHGSINLLAFYARRARRLLPAFFVVMAATLLLGAVFLVPLEGEQADFAHSAVAAALYFANVHFALYTGGYFDRASDMMPLLHTWSLAVEEQFYFIWPLMLAACAWAASRRRLNLTVTIAVVLAVLFITSLTISWLASMGSEREARFGFYMLPSRAWELAAGALLALGTGHVRIVSPWIASGLGCAGLLAIGASVVGFNDAMPFPGAAALFPTVGAVAVIAGGWLAPRSPATRLLSAAPLVAIGVLSYSWYLWHWPLLAIVRVHELAVADVWRDSAVAAAALALAWLTYVYIEHPIRSRKLWGNWTHARALGAAAAVSVALILGGQTVMFYSNQLAKTDYYVRFSKALADTGWTRKVCHHKKDSSFVSLKPQNACMRNTRADQNNLVLLWGDSHADHLAAMVEKAGKDRGLILLSRSMSRCPPVLDISVFVSGKLRKECVRFNAEVLAEIDRALSRGELAAVILSARWRVYLGQPDFSGKIFPTIVSLGGQDRSTEAAPAALTHGLKEMLRTLIEKGVKVLLIAPVPEQRFHSPSCLARKNVEFCSTTSDQAEEHRSVALRIVKDAAQSRPGVRIWDPAPPICQDGRCLIERDGVVLFRDNNHLSYNGSLWLSRYFEESAAWLAGEQRGASMRPRN